MSAPDLACVVLAVGEAPYASGAVASLAAQSEVAEIVVVRSAGGRDTLPAGVRGVEVEGVPPPGATRNAGVAATRAPWVAFLAADSEARPGWVAARLAAHRAGAEAVATAVVPHRPCGAAAWASYFALSVRRMPCLPASEALRYGVSYSRALLEAIGPFPEQLRVGEDSVVNARAAERAPIAWVPEARTAHRHPATIASMLRDQHARGARAAAALRELSGLSPRAVARNALARLGITYRLAWRYLERGERRHLLRAAPLLPLAAWAYARGARSLERAQLFGR